MIPIASKTIAIIFNIMAITPRTTASVFFIL